MVDVGKKENNRSIRLAGVVRESIVDGPGIRFVVFTQGCAHKCAGCHNPETHDNSGGYESDIDTLFEEYLKNPLLKGITMSGGEPFLQAEQCAKLCEVVKKAGGNVITFTGFTFEQLLNGANDENHWMDLIKCSDYIIDGKFDESKKTMMIPFKGSSNQRFINVKQSLEQGEVVELNRI